MLAGADPTLDRPMILFQYIVEILHRSMSTVLQQRFESLRKLAPREAVQAWLNGEFGIDDEPALIEALRRDPRVIGSDDQIIDTFCNAMVEGWDAQRTFERLTHSA